MKKGYFILAIVLMSGFSGAIPFLENTSFTDLKQSVEIKEIKKTGNQTGQKNIIISETGLNMPVGIIGIILSFLAIIIYSTDISPFWMTLAVLNAALGIIVYEFSLPLLLVPLSIIVSIAGVYLK